MAAVSATNWRGHLAFGAVLAGVLLALVRIVQYHWREGAAIIGVTLLFAAGLRAILSPERAGLLVVRGQRVDVLTYGGSGLLMLAVALTITGGPLGDG
ncbi:MAG: DUF3017 domain-containing protein [Pseudonocardiaceae bacterium]